YGRLRRHVERGVKWIHLARGVRETDVAQLAVCITTAPLCHLGAEPLELLPRFAAVVAQPPKIPRRRHGAPWLPVRVRRCALRESSSVATANGLVAPLSRSANRSST